MREFCKSRLNKRERERRRRKRREKLQPPLKPPKKQKRRKQLLEVDKKSRKASAEKTIVRTFAPTPTNKNIAHFGKLRNPALGVSKSKGSLIHAHDSSTSSIGRPNPKQ